MFKIADYEIRFGAYLALIILAMVEGAMMLVASFLLIDVFAVHFVGLYPYAPLSNLGASLLFVSTLLIWSGVAFFKYSAELWRRECERFILRVAVNRISKLLSDC